MNMMITTAIALFAGLMMTRLFKALHLQFPDVTAFLIAGLFVGPFGLGRLHIQGLGFGTLEEVDSLRILNEAALGFIAFSIGAEFKMSDLEHTGKKATVIGIIQAVFTTLLVDAALIGMHLVLGEERLPLSVAVTLGAIASATAPAATLMVVRQYKADGPVTRLLLPIVALDDAVGLVVFAVSFGIAQAMEGGVMNVMTILVNPLIEIVASLILGMLMGFLLSFIEKMFYSNTNRLNITICFVLTTITLSSWTFSSGELKVSFSSLLVCMMAGTVFCNAGVNADDIFSRCDKWTSPLYAVFFVLSGAALDLNVFKNPAALLVGVIYVLSRCAGKYLGARSSSRMMKCGDDVIRYLGITLFPQAGVALGMVLTAQSLGNGQGAMIRNVILFSVLIYELAGPSLTKWALTKAGEISEIPAEKKTQDRFRKLA